MKNIRSLIIKAVGAAFAISLGVYGVLYIENAVLSAFLFSLGLLTVCTLELNLFTGKCGFVIESGQWMELLVILLVNLLSGYLFGMLFGLATPGLTAVAAAKLAGWELSLSYFIKSCFCGAIMYLAVKIYKLKNLPAGANILGILIGVPMFILCGFQHCIANVITMGTARSFSPALLLCIVGNFVGSLIVWAVTGGLNPTKEL